MLSWTRALLISTRLRIFIKCQNESKNYREILKIMKKRDDSRNEDGDKQEEFNRHQKAASDPSDNFSSYKQFVPQTVCPTYVTSNNK